MGERLRFEAELSDLDIGHPLEREAGVPRSRVGDPQGETILNLLWEPIDEADVPRMADRLRRLERVLDAVPDDQAGALLRRLSPGGDLVRDFDYRLSTPTRNRLREKLRLRQKQRVPVPPPIPPPPPPPPVKKKDDPKPKPIPIPTPVPVAAQKLTRILGAFVWKPAKWKLLEYKIFDVFLEWEVEVIGSVDATDQDWLDIKPRWTKSTGSAAPGGVSGPGIEIEAKLEDWFIDGVKVELDRNGGLKISFFKEFHVTKYVQISPHLQLSKEFFTIEVEIQKLEGSVEILGHTVKVELKPKGTLQFEVDWVRALKERIKQPIKDWIRDKLRDLLKLFGRGVAGAIARKVLAAMLGTALAKLFLDDPPNVPVRAPPGDVGGKQEAERWLLEKATTAAEKARMEKFLQDWADRLRNAYANAYADTLRRLMSPGWRDALDQLSSVRGKAFKQLPSPRAPIGQWKKWADAKKAMEVVSLPLSHQAPSLLRWYEVVLMVAAAAYLLRRITKPDLDGVIKVCMEQGSLAGMSLAAVYVRRQINRGTFRYRDQRGTFRSADGKQRWDDVVAFVKASGITPDEINERFAALAQEQLPPK